MLRRHLDRGDVLVQRKQRHLLAGRDMQHMHALARLRRRAAAAARSRRARLRRRAIRCGSTDRLARWSLMRSFSLASSSEWKAARRLILARMRASVSSSSTRRSPVEEPMKTLMPAAPGRSSSSASSSTLSRVAPTKKAKSQCMRPVARGDLVGERLGAGGRRLGVRHLEHGGDAAQHRRPAARSPDPPCARARARGNAPGCRSRRAGYAGRSRRWSRRRRLRRCRRSRRCGHP